jgi:FkbH-like protein
VKNNEAEPLSLEAVLRSRKRLRRVLAAKESLTPIRIAVLGGVTTNELVDFLELQLLAAGFAPTFYQSEYNKYYEEGVLDTVRLVEFKPHLVYVHTHWLNVVRFPAISAAEADLRQRVEEELARFRALWGSIQARIGCQIIQNNFEHPPAPVLGNFDSISPAGRTRFINELNLEFARCAQADNKLLVHDINVLAAHFGAERWFDPTRWYSYKIPVTPAANYEMSKSLSALICAALGRVKKVLILDLDNTLWGGVIGDDGLDRIQIGRETPVAEAYTAFQEYCLALHERGILLAVCSKNDEQMARRGFGHPESVLKLEHFAAFKANWNPKHENIKEIASELNLGLDSFVFVDDNPAERALVAAQLPMLAVPDVGANAADFIPIIHAQRYFETVNLSAEDIKRTELYATNTARAAVQAQFASYDEYLQSLNMQAEIAPFKPVYLERITQLINKTNQFNLTTRRYAYSEVEAVATSPGHITLYGKLSDNFGDNGLVSIVIGTVLGLHVEVDLWVMSCRVLKRGMELAMFNALVSAARRHGATRIVGKFIPTERNSLVEHFYRDLGFTMDGQGETGGTTKWWLDISASPQQPHQITVQ